MKIKTALCALGVATLAASVLAPVALAIDTTIDYAHSIGELEGHPTSNILVQATDDGGYVVAGVATIRREIEAPGKEVYQLSIGDWLSCGEPPIEEYRVDTTPENPDLNANRLPKLCGYVAKYAKDGSQKWITPLYDLDYASADRLNNYYVEDILPYQLKETTAGIGMMTGMGDYFLFNASTGEIARSYHVGSEDDNYAHFNYLNINNDGSTAYNDGNVVVKNTTDGVSATVLTADSRMLNALNRNIGSIITTQDKVYFVDCGAIINLYTASDANSLGLENISAGVLDNCCRLYYADDHFSNISEISLPGYNSDDGSIMLYGGSDQLIMIAYSDNEGDDGYVAVLKDNQAIAKRHFTGESFDTDEEADNIGNLMMMLLAAKFGNKIGNKIGYSGEPVAVDMIDDGEGGIAFLFAEGASLAFMRLDSNLAKAQEVQLDMASEETMQIADVAFLRDQSMVRVGFNVSSSNHYNITGNRNGVYAHYGAILPAKVNPNPDTLDNITYVVAGFGALLAGGFVVMKLRARR